MIKVALLAHFLDASGQSHQLQLWREGQKLRRDTDDSLQIVVEDDRWQVIDRRRGRFYRAHQSSLARLGSFPDRDTLATLGRPKGSPLRAEMTPVGPCRWFEDHDHRICWSQRWQVALIAMDRK